MSNIITAVDIMNYHQRKNNRHPFYKETCELFKGLKVHFDGSFPGDIIKLARPNESEEVRKWREDFFVPNTKPVVMRVFNSLQKIRKSPDWVITFSTDLPNSIPENESPQVYMSEKFPTYDSLTNWAFSIELLQQLIDSGAFVLTLPQSNEVPVTEFKKPINVIFNSPDVYDYVENSYYVFKSKEINNYAKSAKGAVYYVADTTNITRYIQTSPNLFTIDYTYPHNCPEIPVSQLKGIVVDYTTENTLCESRIQSMVPSLQESIRQYSDLVGLMLLQVPRQWMYQQQACPTCEGNKRVSVTDAAGQSSYATCGTCKGSGHSSISAFGTLIVKPEASGETAVPTPPGGYYSPDVAALKFLQDTVDIHNYNALSAINMQDIADVPAVNSGIAKQVDRQDQENWVHSVAEDMVRVMDRCAWFTVIQRYGFVLNYNMEELRKLVPVINVPEKFDLSSTQSMLDDLAKLKSAGTTAAIFNAVQIDLAGKLFPANNKIKKLFELSLNIDPLSGITSDEISTAHMNGWVSDLSAVLHYNKDEFIQVALQNNADFYSMDRAQQVEILAKQAQDLLNTIEQEKAKLMQTAQEQAANLNPAPVPQP